MQRGEAARLRQTNEQSEEALQRKKQARELSREIAFQADVDPDLPSIPGDPGRLQQVVWNLLSNAIKFTPAGGAVRP